jgi:hypothetical protein
VPETQISFKIFKIRVEALFEMFWRTMIKIPSRPEADKEREDIAEKSSLGLKSAERT